MKRIGIIILILLIAVGVTAWLNREDLEERQRSQEDAILLVTYGGEEMEVTFDDILVLPRVEFDAVLRTSARPPVDTSYTGVEMSQLLEAAGVDLDAVNQVVTRAVDGYTVALTGEEVRMADNVYIVYERYGEDLGTREDGGSGPYQMVIREDEFGQRWNKFLMRIEVE